MPRRLSFVVEEAVAEAFPGHATGLVRVRSERAVSARPGAVAELARRYQAAPQAARLAAERWADVYRAMGAKPKYACSVQRLREMEHVSGRLTIPVPLVEFYCWFSLVVGIPMAGYRPERVTGELRLAMPGAGVPFTPLGQARGSQEKTKPREVAYVDDDKAICRYWNYRDCDQTKLVADVSDVLFVFDLVGSDVARFEAIAAEFGSYLAPGKVSTGLASRDVASVVT